MFNNKYYMNKNNMILYFDQPPNPLDIKNIVGGQYTVTKISRDQIMYYNKNPDLNKLKFNKKASKLSKKRIFGKVLIIS